MILHGLQACDGIRAPTIRVLGHGVWREDRVGDTPASFSVLEFCQCVRLSLSPQRLRLETSIGQAARLGKPVENSGVVGVGELT